MGDIMRKLANDNNMDIVEFNNYIQERKEFDNKLDELLVKIANTEDKIVFSSRTAWHFIPESFKIYLTVSDDIAAKRVFEDNERIFEKKYSSIEEALESVKNRNQMETKRYMDIYGIDVAKKENYDLYLDTSNLSLNEIIQLVLDKYRIWLKGKV